MTSDRTEVLALVTLVDGDLKLEFVKLTAHPVHKAPTYYFHMIHSQTGEELGGINLRVGSTPHLQLYAGHIGYTVHPAHRGHRYAARSVRLLMAVARQLDFEILWITCDPENIGSRRTAELAGAQFVEIVDVPEDCIIHQAGHQTKCRYRLDVIPAALDPKDTSPSHRVATGGHNSASACKSAV